MINYGELYMLLERIRNCCDAMDTHVNDIECHDLNMEEEFEVLDNIYNNVDLINQYAKDLETLLYTI